MCHFNHIYIYSLVVLTIVTGWYNIYLERFHHRTLKFYPNDVLINPSPEP